MDMNEKDKFGLEKSGDHLNYHSSGISSDWQFSNTSGSLVPANPSAALCQVTQMDSSPCPSASMGQSFSPNHWNSFTNSQSPGFCDNSVEGSTAASNSLYIGKPVPRPPRPDLGWSSSDSSLKGGIFRQTVPGIPPPSLSHFRADSAFIERAARFSSFNGDNLSGMVNHFSTSESLSPYSISSKGASGSHTLKSDGKMQEPLKDASLANDHGCSSVSPMEAKRNQLHGVSVSGNELGKIDVIRGSQEEAPGLRNAAGETWSKDLAANKRKRTDQDVEFDQIQGAQQMSVETTNENTDSEQEGEQNNSTIATVKPNGKQAKGGSDPTKEEYIHMRARRGQATNSHSLAERVRREKISERMKYLQDLVPGCSKVTGKAVMLDEIINYVQSLQRQVEFLSMKLATVNPRLDLNIDTLLSKDLLQSRGGPSSAVGFSADMLHPFQQGLVQAGMPGITDHSDALRRVIHAQLTTMNEFKESMPQMPNVWDQEFHNVAQMTFGCNAPSNVQEINGKPHNGFP